MRSLTIISFAICCLALQAGEVPALVEKTVLDGKVQLLLPQTFAPMGEKMLQIKYPKEKRPTLVYTNEWGTVNVTFNHAPNKLPATELPNVHKAMEATFKKLYPSAEWFRSELKNIHGRQFILLELRTPAVDTEVRNIILATSFDDRLLLISFNCIRKLEDPWMPTGNKIMESIVVGK